MKQGMIISCTVVFLSIFFPLGAAGSYPDTIHVPVTFWDYHSDGSNPEFEKTASTNIVHLRMIDSTLDTEKKPVLGPVPFWNCCIAKWFRPWAAGDFTIPNYTNPATTICNNPDSTVDYDTAFKNIRIDTFLVFTLVAGSQGTYEFVSSSFFPLDGKGFGSETRTHNYSFAMELHWSFTKAPNMTFSFTGDDDVWAFLNNKLAMDIGGIHNPIRGSVTVDTIPGLVNGQKYSFDFFSAERHVTSSSIRISSNIISASQPLRISVSPDDTIQAGDTVLIVGALFDINGVWLPNLSDSINWSLDQSTFEQGDKLLVTQNDTTRFTGTFAYRKVGVIGSYHDSIKQIFDTSWISIIPQDPVGIEKQKRTPVTSASAYTSPALTIILSGTTLHLPPATLGESLRSFAVYDLKGTCIYRGTTSQRRIDLRREKYAGMKCYMVKVDRMDHFGK